MRKGRVPFIITFLAPPLALYVVFVLSPFVQGIQISFTDWTGFTPQFSYVGFDNYTALIRDSAWWHAALNNVKLLLVIPAVTLVLALVFATLLTRGGTGGARSGLFGSRFYRVVYFFPQIIPVVIVAIMFQFIYSTQGGLLQQSLDFFGLDLLRIIPNGPLGNPGFILWSIMFVAVWSAVGFYMVLFIAGMQQIPREFYEAAAIDGATRFRMFRHLTLPLLWGHVQVSLVYIGVGTLDMFALLSVMARNGVSADFGADVMATQLFRTAFALNSQFGYASAMATMLLIFSLLLAVLTFRFTRRERLEY
ncbi:carbohydrate ABC transporter permease [Actinopolymorpha pittospori]|uniref:N-acetylglucosamine transport system permease protein n=1 Tax=Actinopolymorpha pittospori TaxID=648752 RepID=A0A927N4T4_9ACTN|nr:sugar ABC transporter permease [Actinopolymorpha pittospori]MBE1612371.1 N-acetylglucosamine transport system permease protein [Actinopolymorpha pittospori]